MDEIKKMLENELGDLLINMKDLDATGEDYKKMETAAIAIADRIIRIEEIHNAIKIEELKQDGRIAELENNLEVESIKAKIPKTRVVLDVAKMIVPPLLYFGAEVWGINKAQKFESSGYTLIMKSSQEIRNFLSKMVKF